MQVVNLENVAILGETYRKRTQQYPWPKLVIEARLKLGWQVGFGVRLTDKPMKLNPCLVKTPSRPHRLPCRSPPPAWKLPTPWPASGRKSTSLHLPIVPKVIESRGRVLDRVDTASWKCPLQYSNLNLASLKIEAGDGMITNWAASKFTVVIFARIWRERGGAEIVN